MRRDALAVVAVGLLVFTGQRTLHAEPPLYTVQNLGTFGGLVPTITGINAGGQIVGNVAAPDGNLHAARYLDGLGWRAVPGLESGYSLATGINVSGEIVGYHITPSGLRAYRYTEGIGLQDIAPLPGGTFTAGFAINTAGDVAGYGDSFSGIVPFRAGVGLPAAALPSLNGGFALACGTNDAGQVVGWSYTATGGQAAMRVDPGAAAATAIQSFDGPVGSATACAIDADGSVGGQASHGGLSHAFRFGNTGLIDLDSFGSSMSNVESIAGGLSAGWYTLPDGSLHAFAHRDADGSFDLNSRIDPAGWVLSQAKAVNASGVIAGQGTLNGAPAAFVLTPSAARDTTAPVIASVTATPSVIAPPKGQVVPITVTVVATDDSGKDPVCSVTGIAAPGSAPGDASVTGPLSGTVAAIGGRTYTVRVACADAAGNTATGSADVVVPPDTTPPVIAALSATPSSIWPPNRKMVPVSLTVSATDDVDASPQCSLTGISGAPAGDFVISGPLAASLRAEKNADGALRTYLLQVTCSDRAGNKAVAAVSVSVSKAEPSWAYHYDRRLGAYVHHLRTRDGDDRN